MKNWKKGFIIFFIIVGILAVLFQFSLKFAIRKVEKKAIEYSKSVYTKKIAKEIANGDSIKEKTIFDSIAKAREKYYLDSMQNEVVLNLLWLVKFTYKECKENKNTYEYDGGVD
jgi:hypothetical protein